MRMGTLSFQSAVKASNVKNGWKALDKTIGGLQIFHSSEMKNPAPLLSGPGLKTQSGQIEINPVCGLCAIGWKTGSS